MTGLQAAGAPAADAGARLEIQVCDTNLDFFAEKGEDLSVSITLLSCATAAYAACTSGEVGKTIADIVSRSASLPSHFTFTSPRIRTSHPRTVIGEAVSFSHVVSTQGGVLGIYHIQKERERDG